MDISGQKYDSCCRTCLNDGSEEMHDIFEYSDSVNIVEILSTYTSIRVTMDDQLPKKLCRSCYHCLLCFHKFTHIALNNDKALREYYTNLQQARVKQEYYYSTQSINEHIDQPEVTIKEENVEYNYEDNIENTSQIYTETNVIKHSKKKIVRRKRIKNETIYDRHLIPYTNEYNCTQCTAQFKDRRCYIKHIIKHNKEIQTPIIPQVVQNQSIACDVCSLTFKTIQSRSAHKKVHIEKDRVLQCKICDKVFKKYSHLKRHELSTAHNDMYNRPFKCSLCKKSYATEVSLAAHVDMHNGVKTHHCPVCMRNFCHRRSLCNHIKVHTQEKPYLCPTCGKMFESSTNLNQHLRRHAGEKLFACNLCPRTFISKGELKSHGLSHSGEKSFTCDQCSKAFTKRCSLEKHKFTHLGVKPHQCDVCGMKFLDKNHLKRHYRIHTGEKPYRCEICERAFTQSNDLLKHKRTHLGNNLYKCDECSQSFRLKAELRQHISHHFISAQLGSKVAVDTEQSQTLEGTHLEVLQPNILEYKEQ